MTALKLEALVSLAKADDSSEAGGSCCLLREAHDSSEAGGSCVSCGKPLTALKLEAQEQSDCPLERVHALSGMTCGCSIMCSALKHLECGVHMSVSDMDPCSSWLAVAAQPEQ